MSLLRLATYNLHDYGKAWWRDTDAQQRYALVRRVIRELDVDVLAVQELCGSGAGDVALEKLAAEVELTCRLPPPYPDELGAVTVAPAGGHRDSIYHVGLLWRADRVEPIGTSWRRYDHEMWHNLTTVDFDTAGGQRIRIGSYHAGPFGKEARVDEAERVASALTRPYDAVPPGLVGADWNSVSADRVQTADGRWEYHARDPYDAPWREPYIYQCQWQVDPTSGQPGSWSADRRPGETLWAAGVRDTAALTGNHAPTTGHFAPADMGPRAIDTWRANTLAAPAVLRHEVIDTDLTRAASDHLPVVVTLDVSRLPHPVPVTG